MSYVAPVHIRPDPPYAWLLNRAKPHIYVRDGQWQVRRGSDNWLNMRAISFVIRANGPPAW
jgi:hypothetical protein